MNENNEIILDSTPEGDKKVGVLFHDENFWLTQKAIAQLFDVEVPAISKHLANIYDSGELEREATVSILETVRQEGNRNVKRKLEYETYRERQDCEYVSDFDREVKRIQGKQGKSDV